MGVDPALDWKLDWWLRTPPLGGEHEFSGMPFAMSSGKGKRGERGEELAISGYWYWETRKIGEDCVMVMVNGLSVHT